MTTISSTRSLILDLPPSCIEFSPSHPQYFVVGTYFLEKSDIGKGPDEEGHDESKKPQQRSGSLVLFRLNGEDITQMQTHPTPSAILDLHFCPQNPSILCTATSTGTLDFYSLTTASSEGSLPLSLLSSCRVTTSGTLILSFSFHPTLSIFAATLSTGEVTIGRHNIGSAIRTAFKIEIAPSALPTVLEHTLEAWTSTFSSTGNGIFSGGDDCMFQYRSLNFSDCPDSILSEDDEGANATWSNRKAHVAGVTAILPLTADVVVTGSYDDHIRVFSVVGRPRVLAELNIGGGVWRLKLIETIEKEDGREIIVLASCMHAGARVASVRQDGDGEWNIEVLAKFEEHKSMNYGSDVQPISQEARGGMKARERVIVSTSFYDKLLCLWKWKED